MSINNSLPNETQGTKQYDDYRVSSNVYSNEPDVYDITGFNSLFLQTLGALTQAQVTTLINGFISKADERIRRWLGVPITVRKEGHEFFNNPVVQLGPEREDPFEMFGSYDVSNKTVEIYAIYYNEYRTKVPYPKDWDQFTEPATVGLWGIDNGIVGGPTTTLVADTINFKCGTGSLNATITRTTGGNIIFPKNKNFNRRIYPWFYCGFYFMTDTPSANFTFRMVRSTGSYYYGNFTASSVGGALANTWIPIQLSIRRFQFANVAGEGAQPDFNWILTPTQYIMITADRPCKFWIDNFSFNDGFFATYPEGTISWCMPEWYPSGRITVTYSFDPYLVSIPPALLEASSKLAGVLLIDWAIGKRQMAIAFEQLSDTLAESPDKVTLENTRRRLETEAYTALETLGYKSYEGMG